MPDSRKKSFSLLGVLRVLGFMALAGVVVLIILTIAVTRNLPSTAYLEEYQPPVSTKIHAASGAFIAELTQQSRTFVPIERIPLQLRNAFIAAEDRFFYEHFGINPLAISRAVYENIFRVLQGKRLLGASTITQQVAKNFVVGNRRTLIRKLREAVVAVRLEQQLSKNRILELYLNEIYLGGRAYGVASAALRYFDKPISQLTLPEMATLASLTKAPNANDPRRYPEQATILRNITLEQMAGLGMISAQERDQAINTPLQTVERATLGGQQNRYAIAEVRRELLALYGEEKTYGGGLSVRTSIEQELQTYAREALRDGLVAYDRRHGYRGPVAQITLKPENIETLTQGHVKVGARAYSDLAEAFLKVPVPKGLRDTWRLAVVFEVAQTYAIALDRAGRLLRIDLSHVAWARDVIPTKSFTELTEGYLYGPKVIQMNQVMDLGDVIIISVPEQPVQTTSSPEFGPGTLIDAQLEQIPAIEGGIIALSPQSGRIFAVQGGWSFAKSQLNRTRQARRQPGSAFKPFVYLTALEQGLTPSSRVLDAPITLASEDPFTLIKPSNYSDRYFGPSTLRLGIEKSRNLMTLRLARAVGISQIANTATRMGIVDAFPLELGNALGAMETTPLRLLRAYASLANGGRAITPTIIDQIQDRDGVQIFAADQRECLFCDQSEVDPENIPVLRDTQPRWTNPVHAYQMTRLLEGVIQRGTGQTVRRFVAGPVAGKTGTTNNNIDTWFVGYTPNIAVAVYVGFDQQRPLGLSIDGRQETGASVAAPIFGQFMGAALAHFPQSPFAIPAGVSLVRVNAVTGALLESPQQPSIVEAFAAGSEPTSTKPLPLIGEQQISVQPAQTPLRTVPSQSQGISTEELY